MHVRMSVAIVTCLLALPVVANAQTPVGDVTLLIPVNLTKLSSKITQVYVRCLLMSDAFPASFRASALGGPGVREIDTSATAPVSGGQIVTTMKVVFSIGSLDSPNGKTATYLCNLGGGMPGYGQDFSITHNDPAWRVSPNTGGLRGAFTW